MVESNFRIFRWLSAIIVLLIVPSLLLAFLWVRDARDEVRRVDQALKAMDAIEVLQPVVGARAVGSSIAENPRWHGIIESFDVDDETLVELDRLYHEALLEESDISALDAARDLVRLISRATLLEAATPQDYLGISNLITEQLLSVAQQSLRLMNLGTQLGAKAVLNPWDRMALPVQGGQFRAVSEEAPRVAELAISDLPEGRREALRKHVDAYMAANLRFQGAVAQLVRSMARTRSGAELDLEDVARAYPVLVQANTGLLFTLNATLRDGLRQRKDSLQGTLIATSLICLTFIFIALAAAVGVCRSLTARTQREIDNVGFHDPLTGLPNRRSLMLSMDRMLAGQDDARSAIAVLHISLSRFKAVNDTLGVEVGDALLCRIAADLEARICVDDIVTRIGGDEFVVVVKRFATRPALVALASRIRDEIAAPKVLQGERCRISAYVGIADTTDGLKTTQQLLLDAELALRTARKEGGEGVRLFDGNLRAAFDMSNATAQRLRAALDAGHIEPWFQPQIDIAGGRVTGVEALVRWIDPEHGITPPNLFLPVAEEFGLSKDVDLTVRRKSLAALRAWRDSGLDSIHMGLNMSAAQLAHPDLVEGLIADVEKAGLKPQEVSIEILESVMLDEKAADPIKANVARLSDLGFYIELDDFGTGHSGLSSLRDLKINRVKIDRTFVDGVDRDPELATLTRALIGLAQTLNIDVLAEGVETEGEYLWLSQHGCQVVQGFLISKPLRGGEILEWCANQASLSESQGVAGKATTAA